MSIECYKAVSDRADMDHIPSLNLSAGDVFGSEAALLLIFPVSE